MDTEASSDQVNPIKCCRHALNDVVINSTAYAPGMTGEPLV